MDSASVTRLIQLNKEFYTRFGDSFSATRQRIQPGVRRVLNMLQGDEDILDLGCGNGEFARELAKQNHRGTYRGVDFSLPLLRDALPQPEGFSATFAECDLTQLSPESKQLAVISEQLQLTDHCSVITCFAVLHHIPSTELRVNILRTVHQLLKPNGLFIHSNWQFLNSEKLKGRILPWETGAGSGVERDAGDYLLDWRSGGEGVRYVHHFDERELAGLAQECGFTIRETFYSDGATGDLGLYQVWAQVSD